MNTRFLAVAALALVTACQSQRPAQQAAAQDDKTPVAKIGDTVITSAELDQHVKGELKRMEAQYLQSRYELRKQGLDDLINRRIVGEKAKAAGLKEEEYLRKEMEAKIPAPTDAELKTLYDNAVKGGQQLPPFEQIKPQIADFVRAQRGQAPMMAYLEELRKNAKVEVLLPAYEPPKVEVAATGPSKGPEGAKVTIVEFSDFECPYCVRAEATVKEVLAAYGDKVRLVYRDYPLPNHAKAPKAAEAAHCAGDQNKYWEMHERLFSTGRLTVPELKQHAKDLGLDAAKFDGCLDGGEKAKLVEEHKKAGEEAGVSGTPAFFINGRPLQGAQPLSEFKRLIDAELSRS